MVLRASHRKAAYRLCPLEQLSRRQDPLGEWNPVPLSVFDSAIKPGVLEELAAFLNSTIHSYIPLVSLKETIPYIRLMEDYCGYDPIPESRLVTSQEGKKGQR